MARPVEKRDVLLRGLLRVVDKTAARGGDLANIKVADVVREASAEQPVTRQTLYNHFPRSLPSMAAEAIDYARAHDIPIPPDILRTGENTVRPRTPPTAHTAAGDGTPTNATQAKNTTAPEHVTQDPDDVLERVSSDPDAPISETVRYIRKAFYQGGTFTYSDAAVTAAARFLPCAVRRAQPEHVEGLTRLAMSAGSNLAANSQFSVDARHRAEDLFATADTLISSTHLTSDTRAELRLCLALRRSYLDLWAGLSWDSVAGKWLSALQESADSSAWSPTKDQYTRYDPDRDELVTSRRGLTLPDLTIITASLLPMAASLVYDMARYSVTPTAVHGLLPGGDEKPRRPLLLGDGRMEDLLLVLPSIGVGALDSVALTCLGGWMARHGYPHGAIGVLHEAIESPSQVAEFSAEAPLLDQELRHAQRRAVFDAENTHLLEGLRDDPPTWNRSAAASNEVVAALTTALTSLRHACALRARYNMTVPEEILTALDAMPGNLRRP